MTLNYLSDGERDEGTSSPTNNISSKDEAEEVWDIVIKSKSPRFKLNLGEAWRYRDLMWLFVKRDFIAKYKQTILGPLWHLIQPALTTAMAVFIFNKIANIGTEGKNAVLFQMAGTIIWSFFSVCLTSTSATFVTNANIFGKVYFPRIVSPLSIVISNIVQMGIMLGLLLVSMLFFFLRGPNPGFEVGEVWMVPIVVSILGGLSLGLGIIFSSLTTKYRDIAVLITFGVQLLSFASAVQYPLSVLMKQTEDSPWLYNVVKWNPLSILVDTFRNAMLGGEIHYAMVAYTSVFMIFTLLIGILFFNRVEKTFMDSV
jgi:lipopolysaccharide transport system permease protein